MRIFQPDRLLLDAFVAAHAPAMGGKILDVGGQDGRRYRSHFTKAESYVTLDPDPSWKPDLVATAESIPLPDASVDGILCMEVLMYVPVLQDAMREMARVLKPGGTLMATTSFMSTPVNHSDYYWQPAPAGFRYLMDPHFDDVRVEPRGAYHALRAQNRIRKAILDHRLYERTMLGRLASPFCELYGRWALWRDGSSSPGTRAFTMGFNILATKR